jgi:hypothetical protein
MDLKSNASRLNIEVECMEREIGSLQKSILSKLYKNKISTLKKNLIDKRTLSQLLNALISNLADGRFIMTTDEVQNYQETELTQMGFYLVKRNVVDSKFEHTYRFDY